MAVAVVRSYSQRVGSASTNTISVNSTGGDLILVQVNTFDDEGTTDGQVSTVTFNGTGLTQAVEQEGIAGTENWAEIWYLASPAQTTANLVVTNGGSTTAFGVFVSVLSGTNTASPIDASVGGTDSATSTASIDITTNYDNSLIFSNAQSESNAYTSEGASQTNIAKLDSDYMWASYKSGGTAGAKTMSFVGSGSDRHCWTAVAIREASTGSSSQSPSVSPSRSPSSSVSPSLSPSISPSLSPSSSKSPSNSPSVSPSLSPSSSVSPSTAPAITCTNLTTTSQDTTTSLASASISPGAYKLLIVSVSTGATIGHGDPSVSGFGLTWTKSVVETDSSTARKASIFWAVTGSSPGTAAITVTQPNSGSMMFSVCEIDGASLTNPIVQSAGNSIYNTAHSSLTVTLAAFSNASNATFGHIRKSTTTAISPGSGFTEIVEWTATGTAYNSEVEFKASNDTTVDWSWASETSTSVGVAVEIAVEGSSSSSSLSPSSSVSPSRSPSSSLSPSSSISPSLSPSASVSPSSSRSPSPSPSLSPSSSMSPSNSPSKSPSSSASPSNSPSRSPSMSPSLSPSASSSPSNSPSLSPSSSTSPSPSSSPSPEDRSTWTPEDTTSTSFTPEVVVKISNYTPESKTTTAWTKSY